MAISYVCFSKHKNGYKSVSFMDTDTKFKVVVVECHLQFHVKLYHVRQVSDVAESHRSKSNF